MSLSAKTLDLAEKWLSWDRNYETSNVIQKLVAECREDELVEMLHNRIQFGTAGLRGKMKAGFAHMNDLVIVQTTQGIAAYLENIKSGDFKNRGVVIGYDCRKNSRLFAQYTAVCFAHRGYKVQLFEDMIHTPLMAYAVLYYNAIAGVMITASHNSKSYNGYKLYMDNGVQINDYYHSEALNESIEQNLEPWSIPEINSSSQLKITYTPLHGVGARFMKNAFAAFQMKDFIPVESQIEPNSKFPTVEFPNPEEGEDVFRESIKTADSNQSQIIIANDPDADRMSAAEKLENGTWRIFTGNEIGILLADWILQNYLRRNSCVDRSKIVLMSSVVSSKMLSFLARYYCVQHKMTLSGFKWIAGLATLEVAAGNMFLFGYEEAIGYMIGCNCYEKDGILSGVVLGEMANFLYSRGLSLASQLLKIEKKIGYISSNNGYFLFDKAKIQDIFSKIRNAGVYFKSCGKFEVKSICDLTSPGYDSSTPDNKPVLPVSSQTQMIIITFCNDATMTLRSSGTEPKLKYYSELSSRFGQAKVEVDAELDELVDKCIKCLIQPEKYDN